MTPHRAPDGSLFIAKKVSTMHKAAKRATRFIRYFDFILSATAIATTDGRSIEFGRQEIGERILRFTMWSTTTTAATRS
jgi:hypothetical protein